MTEPIRIDTQDKLLQYFGNPVPDDLEAKLYIAEMMNQSCIIRVDSAMTNEKDTSEKN